MVNFPAIRFKLNNQSWKSVLFPVLMLVMISVSNVYGQQYTFDKIQKQINSMDSSRLFGASSWACVLERVSDNKVVAGININKVLIPASSLKIAVTYPAFKLLGPGFRFETIIEYDGQLKDSILHGNIYIRGGGDPTFGSWRFPNTLSDSVFHSILSMIVNAGIKHVNGTLIADAEVFEDKLIPGSWTWEDIGNYYGGGVCGLNYRENQVEIVFQPGKKLGELSKVLRIEPPIKDLVYENEVSTGSENSGDQVIIFGAPYDYHRVFTGTVPLGKQEFTVKGSLPDPALELADELYKYLVINNINIKFPSTTITQLIKHGNSISKSRNKLGVIYSPPLLDILQLTHEKSINLYSDCLLKMIGKIKKDDGSFNAGIDVVTMFWKENGLDINNLVMKDGSGLSTANRISPLMQSEMMCIIDRDNAAERYIKTLNQAGESGDLKVFSGNTKCLKKLIAKSGYMKTVRAYTGLIRSGQNNDDLAFSILVNYTGNHGAEIKTAVVKLMEMFCSCKE